MLLKWFCVLLLLETAKAGFLKKKPSFLVPCSLLSEYLNQCYARNLQLFFHEWVSLEVFKENAIDPLRIKHMEVDKNLGSTFNIHATWDDIEILGANRGTLTEFNLYRETFNMKGKIMIPRLYAQGDYNVVGNILSMYLNANGKAYFDSENVTFTFDIENDIDTVNEFTFTKPRSIQIDIASIGKMHILVKDLIKNDPYLQKNINIHLNRNWRSVFNLFRSDIKRIATQVLSERFRGMFNYVPANFFIKDMPTQTEFRPAWTANLKTSCNKEQTVDTTDDEFQDLLSRFLSK